MDKQMKSEQLISAFDPPYRAIDNLVCRKAVIDHLMITTNWHDEDLLTRKSDHCPICEEDMRGEEL